MTQSLEEGGRGKGGLQGNGRGHGYGGQGNGRGGQGNGRSAGEREGDRGMGRGQGNKGAGECEEDRGIREGRGMGNEQTEWDFHGSRIRKKLRKVLQHCLIFCNRNYRTKRQELLNKGAGTGSKRYTSSLYIILILHPYH